jgi:hypothetical protein
VTLTIPKDGVLVVPSGVTLTVSSSGAIVNNGTIDLNGGTFANKGGILTGDAPVEMTESIESAEITLCFYLELKFCSWN